jgi:hypothetical protein
MCRRVHGQPVNRLIVSVPIEVVEAVDRLLRQRSHPAKGCRAEFVRLAIAEKLARDLMILSGPKGGEGASKRTDSAVLDDFPMPSRARASQCGKC